MAHWRRVSVHKAKKVRAQKLKLKLKLFTTCAGKQERLMSLGPLYFAFHDLLASWAQVSLTGYTYRHT
jgi:hypothetical protein